MYLVHVLLRPRAPDTELTADATAHLRALPSTCRMIEHVVVHTSAARSPVVGVFLLAGAIEEAETAATNAVAGALRHQPSLHGWQLRSAEVPLISMGEWPYGR